VPPGAAAGHRGRGAGQRPDRDARRRCQLLSHALAALGARAPGAPHRLYCGLPRREGRCVAPRPAGLLCGCSEMPVHVKADAGAKRTLNMQRMSTASGKGMHMRTCTSNTSCMCMYVCLHVSVCLSVCVFLAPIARVTCSAVCRRSISLHVRGRWRVGSVAPGV